MYPHLHFVYTETEQYQIQLKHKAEMICWYKIHNWLHKLFSACLWFCRERGLATLSRRGLAHLLCSCFFYLHELLGKEPGLVHSFSTTLVIPAQLLCCSPHTVEAPATGALKNSLKYNTGNHRTTFSLALQWNQTSEEPLQAGLSVASFATAKSQFAMTKHWIL